MIVSQHIAIIIAIACAKSTSIYTQLYSTGKTLGYFLTIQLCNL